MVFSRRLWQAGPMSGVKGESFDKGASGESWDRA